MKQTRKAGWKNQTNDSKQFRSFLEGGVETNRCVKLDLLIAEKVRFSIFAHDKQLSRKLRGREEMKSLKERKLFDL